MPVSTHNIRQLCRKIISSCAVALLCLLPLSAQDRLELGFLAGVGYYLGDLNPSQQFKNPGPSAAFVGRYIFTDRVAMRAMLGYTRISGAYDSSSLDVYSPFSVSPQATPLAEDEYVQVRPTDLDFANNLIDISVLGEINFLSFDHMFRKNETRFSPYLALGLGLTSYKGYDKPNKKKSFFVLSLPFGAGIKYKLNNLLRLGVEWTFFKTFTDQLECVNPDGLSFDPSDPYKNGQSSLLHNNDWYSSLRLMLTFSLWPRSLVCNDGLRSYYKD